MKLPVIHKGEKQSVPMFREDGAIVGYCQLIPSHDDMVYISWKLLAEFRGQGLATAFLRPFLIDVLVYYHRAVAIILPANEPSKHLARALGFRYEGTAIQAHKLIVDNQPVYEDQEFWALLWQDLMDSRREHGTDTRN